ncbi:MAG: SAM-dependent DNA methyltransferase [Betaproteobacteria bacterium]|nr:SAM-dependent DNA methyltransferase [Betaproteobacteria bacterium]
MKRSADAARATHGSPRAGEPFEEKMARMTKDLEAQFEESEKLEALIKKNLKELGYGR